jgi:hypothetical protein
MPERGEKFCAVIYFVDFSILSRSVVTVAKFSYEIKLSA